MPAGVRAGREGSIVCSTDCACQVGGAGQLPALSFLGMPVCARDSDQRPCPSETDFRTASRTRSRWQRIPRANLGGEFFCCQCRPLSIPQPPPPIPPARKDIRMTQCEYGQGGLVRGGLFQGAPWHSQAPSLAREMLPIATIGVGVLILVLSHSLGMFTPNFAQFRSVHAAPRHCQLTEEPPLHTI